MNTRTDDYLQNRDLVNFVIRNTPSAEAQTAKITANTLGGATIGGIVAQTLPFIEEASPGIFGSIPEKALSILKPAFEYFIPTIPSTNYIPFALAGLGGVVAFSFTYYRQHNLNVQSTMAKAALGPISDKLVTDSEFKNIQSLLPDYNLKAEDVKKTIITDKEINQFVADRDAKLIEIEIGIIIDRFLYDIRVCFINDLEEVKEIYEYYKKNDIDEKTLFNQIFAKLWDLPIDEKQKILKFFELNNVKTPFRLGSSENQGDANTTEV